jgi:hypothetical protein
MLSKATIPKVMATPSSLWWPDATGPGEDPNCKALAAAANHRYRSEEHSAWGRSFHQSQFTPTRERGHGGGGGRPNVWMPPPPPFLAGAAASCNHSVVILPVVVSVFIAFAFTFVFAFAFVLTIIAAITHPPDPQHILHIDDAVQKVH